MDTSKRKQAMEFIAKAGTARSPQIAEAVGMEAKNVMGLLRPYVERGDLVMCKVEVPGQRAVNEYRIGPGMPNGFTPLGQTRRPQAKAIKNLYGFAPGARPIIAAAAPATAIEPPVLDEAPLADLGLWEPEPDSHPPAPPNEPRIEFALWESGRLDIYDGAELFQIGPQDVSRLRRFLGCFTEEGAA